jgi:hypothetical protein
MKSFLVFMSVFWSRASFRLSHTVAVLLMALSVALTMHAQSANPVSISPSSGSGSAQTFIATYADPRTTAFVASGLEPDGERRIYKMNLDGSGQSRSRTGLRTYFRSVRMMADGCFMGIIATARIRS